MPTMPCDSFCNCQCHIKTQYKTPRWLGAVVRTLFYCSTRTTNMDVRPCNSNKCVRPQPKSSSHFTYYSPTWMMRSAIVYSTWNNLDGTNSSWVVRIPREISLTSSCWYHICHGNEHEIKKQLETREMSPFDIGPDGVSVLHVSPAWCKSQLFKPTYSKWAERYWQLNICRLLVTSGADWHFKNRIGRYVGVL